MPKIILLSLIFLTSCIQSYQSGQKPGGLMTDLLRSPDQAMITSPNPTFGWEFPQGGVSQTACHILVASSPELLQQEKADLWDSGKMQTSESVNIIYDGKALSPNTTYYWKVKVWGENDFESPYSDPVKFNVGTLSRADDEWPGQSNWIEVEPDNWVAEDRQMSTFHQIEPVSFESAGNNNWFADFGKAAFATLEFEVAAERAGDKLELFLGERKNDDLTVNKNPGVSNIGFFKYDLELKEGTHTYQVEIPRHDARYPHSQKLPPFYPEVLPFRYVEAIGTEGMKINRMTQLALFYYFDDEAVTFNSSNINLNKVWDLCKYTLKATPFLGVYCDGNRERMPYEADAYIQQLGHYSVDREYSAARYTTAFLLSHASWPTEWQMHSVMMAREHYFYTGDIHFLEMVYDQLKKKTLIDLAHDNGLISTRTGKVTKEFLKSINLNRSMVDIVDWPAGTPEGKKQPSNAGPTPEGERDGYVFTDFNTVVNAFHFYSLKCMEEIAEALGKNDDREFFSTQAEKVRKSILENMFDKERGVFVDGIGTDHASLHANMFPLAFNIVPQEEIKTVAEFIKTRGMACSVYGAQYLLEALYNAGEAEYALSLMTAENKRSWMNMLHVGSTMTTEAWDEYYKPNLTWNHAWGAAPANIIPRRLMGVQPLEPGFKLFSVNPQPNGLENLELEIPTIRGTIACKLVSNNNEWNLELSVPGNSEALVVLPAEPSVINVNGEVVKAEPSEVNFGQVRSQIRLKSGDYQIRVSL